jgi:quercetin dioxygenase-like cupin family protein
MTKLFPDLVSKLRHADVPVPGVTAYLLQGVDHQVVFMEFAQEVHVPSHSHGAQWGIVLQGIIDLTIAGEQRTYERGDSYFIPTGVEHSAVVHAGYADVTFFEDRDRYNPIRLPVGKGTP